MNGKNMLPGLSGETRIHIIVGDPIGQTKSPAGLTRVFVERAVDAVCIPMQVPAGDFDAVMAAIKRVQNVDGVVVTVPHKFAATRHCDALSARACALAAVNAMRRGTDGRWTGDMTDGVALLAALRAGGFEPKARRALVVGAGGAGSAVAHALAEAGARVAVHDIDRGRCDDLRQRLAAWGAAAGSADPAGFDLVVNATPLGMTPGDPLPVDAARLGAGAVVADLVTRPVVTPLLAAARQRGARTFTGEDMFARQAAILADFLLISPH
ncbi:MAG TPA: shikimate dehydrogenase [Xanthobacteraceae bacterium]|nr:shikimate dehydrogenase [Xanthobacteraceae bacterium]